MPLDVRRAFLVVPVLLLLLTSSPQAVGTTTVTVASIGDGNIVKYTVAWVSDASGNVTANTAAMDVVRVGYIQQIKFVPDAAGTQPTDLYDVTLVDANAIDLLAGAGANLSNATSTQVAVTVPVYYDHTGTLEFKVANGGNAKGGTFIMWLSPTRR
jgi:hypothetical protein